MIKEKLDIPMFKLAYSTDAEGTVDKEWMRHWENDRRISVSFPADVVTMLKETPEANNLGLQKEERTGKKGAYTSYRVVAYDEKNIVTSI